MHTGYRLFGQVEECLAGFIFIAGVCSCCPQDRGASVSAAWRHAGPMLLISLVCDLMAADAVSFP